MRNQARWHLIAYDIRCPRRLQRVHKLLRTQAYALQESIFAWYGNSQELKRLQADLRRRIKASEDDVRGYPLPAGERLHLWGEDPFAEGINDNGQPPHSYEAHDGSLRVWPP